MLEPLSFPNIRPQRIWEIDFFRGMCVILMILEHFMYDLLLFSSMWQLNALNVFSFIYSLSSIRAGVCTLIAMIFFLLSGISCSFSHSNLLRGFKVLGFSFALSCVVYYVGMNIMMGVLQCLGLSMILYALLHKLCKQKSARLFLGILLAATGIAFKILAIYQPVLFVFQPNTWAIQKTIVEILCIPFHAYSDYYPLLPWFGFFLVGTVFGEVVYRNKRSLLPKVERPIFRPLEFIGRHAIWIYLSHQVLLYGLFTLFGLLNGLQ